jgi:hypothetical protein
VAPQFNNHAHCILIGLLNSRVIIGFFLLLSEHMERHAMIPSKATKNVSQDKMACTPHLRHAPHLLARQLISSCLPTGLKATSSGTYCTVSIKQHRFRLSAWFTCFTIRGEPGPRVRSLLFTQHLETSPKINDG